MGELGAAGGEYGTAFARYEQEMRGYVREGQQLAKFKVTGLVPRARTQIWMRNQAMRLMAHLPKKAREALDARGAANAFTLKGSGLIRLLPDVSDCGSDVRGMSHPAS